MGKEALYPLLAGREAVLVQSINTMPLIWFDLEIPFVKFCLIEIKAPFVRIYVYE